MRHDEAHRQYRHLDELLRTWPIPVPFASHVTTLHGWQSPIDSQLHEFSHGGELRLSLIGYVLCALCLPTNSKSCCMRNTWGCQPEAFPSPPLVPFKRNIMQSSSLHIIAQRHALWPNVSPCHLAFAGNIV